MNHWMINLTHLLLTSMLALGPLSIALYLDLKQQREARQKTNNL
ncbi:MAG TPA: hypothetical protein VFY25_03925 [Anaerolineales bacterium]|nr:hypothetical protein [Anaerolineales bacterium]